MIKELSKNIIVNGNTCLFSVNSHETEFLDYCVPHQSLEISKCKITGIFEPFFTSKMDWKGTGLGLSICYDIIKSHNGSIVVDSQLGKGAVFTIILPAKRRGKNKICYFNENHYSRLQIRRNRTDQC